MIDCLGAFLFACSSLCGPDTAVGVFRWVVEWYGQSLDRASWMDYGAGSRGLSGVWRLGGAWPLDWVREGGTGKAPRTLVLKLSPSSPLLRDLTKLSPWPRLLHTDQITRVIDTGVTISIIPKSHRCTTLFKQLHAFAARHLTIATMQTIPMAQTLPSSMMGKMRAFLCNRIIASRYSES
jgi:hypothetical protein